MHTGDFERAHRTLQEEWELPDQERDCCGSEGSQRLWGLVLGALLLMVGVIVGMAIGLVGVGVWRLAEVMLR